MSVKEFRKTGNANITNVQCLVIGLFVGRIFFDNTIYSERYIDIVHEFLERLSEEEIVESWF
jgi:hypothetical protein